MTRELDLADIQGNVIRAYGQFGFPVARYFFLHIADAGAGRAFVDRVRARVTTSQRWPSGALYPGPEVVPKPPVTLNIGFSFEGLVALGLPTRTLARMPPEFIDGMQRRQHILGDIGPSAPEHWDDIWQAAAADPARAVHVWISMNAQLDPATGRPVAALDEQTRWLRGIVEELAPGVALLAGNGPGKAEWQDAAALFGADHLPSPMEHFGFADGIGDPVFEGQSAPEIEAVRVIGRGKLMPDQTWQPLATGEFILGHPDESQELPPTAPPWEFSRNGTFMAYRKLHQNVASFRGYVAEQAALLARMMDLPAAEAEELIRAKMAGRWSDGVPLMVAPTTEAHEAYWKSWADIKEIRRIPGAERTPEQKRRMEEFRRSLIDFIYRDDHEGIRCPVTAHIRRANTRDMLDPYVTSKDPKDWTGSALNKRRRIMRRGLPYGRSDWDKPDDDGEHGIILMALCASLFRQFEFVQQQWLNYGLDFNVGNDTCPIVGHRQPSSSFVIAADPKAGTPPFICPDLPTFVTTRGGEYFFLPSLSALRMIGMGIVDPT